jgi:hypothetical protein
MTVCRIEFFRASGAFRAVRHERLFACQPGELLILDRVCYVVELVKLVETRERSEQLIVAQEPASDQPSSLPTPNQGFQ